MSSTYLGIAILLLLSSTLYFTRAAEQWEPVMIKPCQDPTRNCSTAKCWYPYRNEHGPYRIYVERM